MNNRNRAAQNTGEDFKKNVAFPEGNSSFAGDFVLIWMKQRLIWFNMVRDGTRNGLSNIKETFSENLQLQMSVLHQSMSIFQGWSLKFIWWLSKITQQFWMFEFSAEDITSDFRFLLRLVNRFTIDSDPVCHKVNMMARPLKPYTYIILCLLIIMYITDWLL